MPTSTKHAVTRRTALGAICAATVGAPLLARQQVGPPPHEKGPKVFLDYDQVELDAAYDQDAYAHNRKQLADRDAANNALVRARLGAPMRVAYGPTEIEKLDIYRTKKVKAPIHIYFHGGAWTRNLAADSSYLAENFVSTGVNFVVPDFAHVQDVGGSLMVMAQQVRGAIAWVYKNSESFGGDRERLYVSGHSSGAHLAGAALIADWQKDFGVPGNFIKGALLASGMYDLRGPRLSSRSSYVKFDDATEDALSTQRHIDKIHMPLIIAYASLDTPEFQRQSREFAAALQAAGKTVELIRGEGYNHFELTETLGNPYGILGSAALRQMGLAMPGQQACG
jgi:arylformamidase